MDNPIFPWLNNNGQSVFAGYDIDSVSVDSSSTISVFSHLDPWLGHEGVLDVAAIDAILSSPQPPHVDTPTVVGGCISELTQNPAAGDSTTSVNVSKPGKSSWGDKTLFPEAVFVKPGKQWRRSISILAKARLSHGETLADVRKSLTSDVSKVKGKRYASTVDTILQMQPNINFITKEVESSNSVLLEQSFKDSRVDGDSELFISVIADEIYKLCGQDGPEPFTKFYCERMKKHCKKIGEGCYGEVFFYSDSSKHEESVIKIIPIEGSLDVNEEPQLTFREIISEVRVALELNKLRQGSDNVARTFNEVQAVRCVQGSYPSWLLELWNDFNELKGSDNSSPKIFQDDQLYIVFELGHGGQDLESFDFSSAEQGLAAFKQVALTLAVGERALKFEHRDLHSGNVLISNTKEKKIQFVLDGKSIATPSKGIQISIIDFTLSRISDPISGGPIFYDMSTDLALFMSEGDYQFEVYRMMKKYCGNRWDTHCPRTNVAWLHYILEKLCTMKKYKRQSSRAHKLAIEKLLEMKGKILTFSDVTSFVNSTL